MIDGMTQHCDWSHFDPKQFEEVVSHEGHLFAVKGYICDDGVQIGKCWTEEGVPLHRISPELLRADLWEDLEFKVSMGDGVPFQTVAQYRQFLNKVAEWERNDE